MTKKKVILIVLALALAATVGLVVAYFSGAFKSDVQQTITA